MKEQSENRTDNSVNGINEENTSRSVLKERQNVQNQLNSSAHTKCGLHINNVLFFCSDCNDVVCEQCENVHSSHATKKLSEASKLTKTSLNSELSKVKGFIRYAQLVIKDLNSYIEKLAVHLAEVTAEILERAEKLPEGSNLLTETLISDIQSEHDSETNRIRDKIGEFDDFVASAKTVAVNCENLCSAADDTYVVTKGKSEIANISGLLKSLPVCPPEKCIYILSPVPASKEGETLSPEVLLGEFSKVMVPWRIEVKRIASIRPEAVASSRFVTTMCPDSHGENVWVSWQWGPLVHLVDKEGNVLKTVDAGCKVDDICTNNGNLVISSHEAKCIKFLNSNFEVVKTIETEKVPRGVYFTSDTELVVCCVKNLHHRNGDISSIVKLRADTGDLKDMDCSEYLVQPWRVAVNHINGDICVSDRNKGAILIFDNEGVLKATYSGPDTSTRHPLAPHAVCCDRFGQIFAVDYTNHTVHVLDPLGRFRGFLIMDTELEKRAIFMGTSSPFSLTIDSVGDVWVGNKFGYLTILKYLI